MKKTITKKPTIEPISTTRSPKQQVGVEKPLAGLLWRWRYLVLIVVIVIGASGWFFVGNDNDNQAVKDIADLVSQVSEHIIVPVGEQPVLSEVTNAENLRTYSSFFSDVQNGDQILIYQKRGQAFIYRPAEDKLVNVGQVSLDQNQTAQTN